MNIHPGTQIAGRPAIEIASFLTQCRCPDPEQTAEWFGIELPSAVGLLGALARSGFLQPQAAGSYSLTDRGDALSTARLVELRVVPSPVEAPQG